MDGKHVTIKCPNNTGSEFFNYKKFFSIVLYAVVDADYRFLFLSVGCKGRISDGGVFKSCTFRKALDECTQNIPAPTPLTKDGVASPWVLVADSALPLAENCLKPYTGSHAPNSKERIFNYRLSRARRTSENAFGILTQRFRVLTKPMELEPEKARLVTLACCYLHNYLRKSTTSRKYYTPPNSVDTADENGHVKKGLWRNEKSDLTSMIPFYKSGRRASAKYKSTRDRFANYFVNEGRVSWQEEYA